jgi:hypothetical protein
MTPLQNNLKNPKKKTQIKPKKNCLKNLQKTYTKFLKIHKSLLKPAKLNINLKNPQKPALKKQLLKNIIFSP